MTASPSPSAEAQYVVSAAIDIAAPPATVFEILADPRQHQRIDGSGTLRGRISGPERLSRGADFGMDMKQLGLPYKVRNHVVEFEEGRLIAWRHMGGHRWRYRLEPTATGTHVTESFDYSRIPTLQRKAYELLRLPARNLRGIEETLPRLKRAAEEDR